MAIKFAALGALVAGILAEKGQAWRVAAGPTGWRLSCLAIRVMVFWRALDKIVKAHCWCSGLVSCLPPTHATRVRFPDSAARFFLFFASGSAPRLPLRFILCFPPCHRAAELGKCEFRPNPPIMPVAAACGGRRCHLAWRVAFTSAGPFLPPSSALAAVALRCIFSPHAAGQQV